MKTQMLIALTLAVALTALVLATWPVVADAPWENEVAAVENNDALRCQGALDYRAAVAANPPTRAGGGRQGNAVLGTSSIPPVAVTDQDLLARLLTSAQSQIDRFC